MVVNDFKQSRNPLLWPEFKFVSDGLYAIFVGGMVLLGSQLFLLITRFVILA